MNIRTKISGYVLETRKDNKVLCTSCYEHVERKVFQLILRPSHAVALNNLQCDVCGVTIFPPIATVDRLKTFEEFISTLDI